MVYYVNFHYTLIQSTVLITTCPYVTPRTLGVGTYSAPTVERIVFIGVKSAPAAVQVGGKSANTCNNQLYRVLTLATINSIEC